MKEVLETIPVWDALKEDTECPICSLMKKAEEDALKYYLGPAVMVPEIRVEINKKGYCNKHWQMLADLNKAQPLALSLDTYYEESKKLYKPKFEQIKNTSNPRKALKLFAQFEEAVQSREDGCLVCDYMKKRLDRYAATFAVLYKEDSDFRAALANSKGFCIHHTLDLVHAAKAELSGGDLASYLQLLANLLDNNLDRVELYFDYIKTQNSDTISVSVNKINKISLAEQLIKSFEKDMGVVLSDNIKKKVLN